MLGNVRRSVARGVSKLVSTSSSSSDISSKLTDKIMDDITGAITLIENDKLFAKPYALLSEIQTNELIQNVSVSLITAKTYLSTAGANSAYVYGILGSAILYSRSIYPDYDISKFDPDDSSAWVGSLF